MCKFMEVSRSGYYEWLINHGCNRDKEDEELSCKIKAIFQKGRSNYGSRPIKGISNIYVGMWHKAVA